MNAKKGDVVLSVIAHAYENDYENIFNKFTPVKMSDVRGIVNGTTKPFKVLEPQTYTTFTTLNKEMVYSVVDNSEDTNDHIGMFYTFEGQNDIAGTGSGYDQWYKIDDIMYNILREYKHVNM